MLVSHESPLCMLEESKKYNDYDYALVHLFEEEPKYLKYFEESIKTRIMYLDNSIFELGTAFDSEKFKKWCNHFCDINEKNFYYIVPDVLENFEKTIQSFKTFNFNRGKKIGVVQGKTFDELIECFKFMKDNCDMVAISFDYSYYLNSEGTTNEEKYMNGRINFINDLIKLKLINGTKIHLLGCFLPQEFKNYKNIPEIISLDTSNPIVHGIKNIKYNNGLKFKEKTKLVDLLYYNNKNKIIVENIRDFKLINDIIEVKKPLKSEIIKYVDKNVEHNILRTYLNCDYKFDELALYHNNEIIGFVSAKFKDNYYKIYYLHIKEKYRGLKLGSYLLEKITNNKENVLYVTDNTTDGIKLFKDKNPIKVLKNQFGGIDYYYILKGKINL